MDKTLLTSDLHFHHKNVVGFTNRHLDTTPEKHTEWLIALWNSQVERGDTVIHLGDFSFSSKYEEVKGVVRQLNGQKIFIKGNHCDPKVMKKLVEDGLIHSFQDYKEIKILGTKTCLFHFPIMSWNQQGRGSWHLHGHCVDDETEILTLSGWKRFGSFSEGESVYSYNPLLKKIEEDLVLSTISINYSGEVYSFSGKSVDFRTTRDHTFCYYDLTNKWQEKALHETNQSARYNVVTSAEFENVGTGLTKEMLQLYICIATDGSIKEQTNLCRIRVKKSHKILFLNKIFEGLNIAVNTYKNAGYTSYNFYIPPELFDWNFKGLDIKLLKATRDEAETIIDAYCNSDGHKQNNGVIIYSAKECEIDMLQQLFATNGFMSTKYSRYHGFSDSPQHQLSVTDNQKQLVLKNRINTEYVDDEHFWCVKTKNQNFFIRRKGKVHLTGNCHGSLKDPKGKMLDVGLDSAYNHFGEHRFFNEEDIKDFMDRQAIYITDHHKEIKEL